MMTPRLFVTVHYELTIELYGYANFDYLTRPVPVLMYPYPNYRIPVSRLWSGAWITGSW